MYTGYTRRRNYTTDVSGNILTGKRPINIVLQKGHTPCYLLDVDISTNLKGRVPVENTSTQNRHSTDESRAIARVKIKKLFSMEVRGSVDFATPGMGTSLIQ